MIRSKLLNPDQSMQVIKLLKANGHMNTSKRYYTPVINETSDPHIIADNKNTGNDVDLNNTLRTIFNNTTGKTTVAQEFKNIVRKLSANPTPLLLDQKDLEVIKKLMLNVLGTQYNKRQPNAITIQSLSTKLNYKIQRGKINNNLIVKRIVQFKETQPINVNIPLKVPRPQINNPSKKIKLKPSLSLSLKDTTQGKTDIVEVLDMLEAHLLNNTRNQNDLYQIFSNILEETNPENLVGKTSHKTMDNDTINLEYLTSYLNRMETQESQKQSVLKEQQRVYNWNQSVKNMNQTNKLILNDIVSLFNPLTWLTKKNKSLQRSVWNLNSLKQIIESEYMVLDLKTGNKEKYDNKAERLPINTQNKDMFEIVNNSQLPPEVTLSKIKSEQQNNWKLLGTLYSNNEKVIFEKRITRTKRSYLSYILGTATLLMISGVSYESYTKRQQKKSPKVKESSTDEQSD
ncbi:hypothetical protein MOUN0_I05292 [Monosporozyma unispora]|nr:hypothetical protein C6P44_003781 [Kazachstania unispora]